MRLLLSHASALEVIRSWDMRAHFERPTICCDHIPHVKPSPSEVSRLELDARRVDVRSERIDVLVGSKDCRVRGNGFFSHVCAAPLPPGSAYTLIRDICCVSPEHLIVQLAPELGKLELQVLMCELMGTYALCREEDGGIFQRKEPLTTIDSVRAHLDALGKFPGVAKTRGALDGVVEGSASPRETLLALRCGLKPSQGGYGIPIRSMNQPLPVPRLGQAGIVGIRKPDILIAAPEGAAAPFSFVAVEYDGDGHLTSEQQAVDAQRTNEILALNGKEYRVNKDIYDDQDIMDDIFGFIRKDIGLNRRRLTTEAQQKNRAKRVKLKRELDFIMATSPIIPHRE